MKEQRIETKSSGRWHGSSLQCTVEVKAAICEMQTQKALERITTLYAWQVDCRFLWKLKEVNCVWVDHRE